MSLQVETLEKSMAKLTIEVSAEEFEQAMEKAYQRSKHKISIPGFRKGKVSRAVIEKMYGPASFYEDAANLLIPDAYQKALGECELEIVSQPKIEVTQVEKGQPFVFTAEVAVKPEVTLGEYKGLEVAKADVTVTDEDVDAEVEKEREAQARMVPVEDRAVQDGDITTIDFEGFMDGKPFEGGKGEDYPLTIGSHSFIDTFEEQLIGANIGEEKEIEVTFPEEYQAKELAGKPATFKVTVKEIKVRELPEADDELAQEVSEFETMAEYREDLRKKIQERKDSAAKTQKEDAAVEKAIENAQMEIPQPMIDTQTRQMADEFAQRLQSQGMTMEQYMQFTGLTPDKLLEQMQPQALKRIQSRLVLEAIAKAENIEISDEKLDEQIDKMAEMYQMEADKLRELMGDEEKKRIREDLAVQEAVTLIADAAVEAE